MSATFSKAGGLTEVERLIKEMVRRQGWAGTDLEKQRKERETEVKIAAKLRKETTMSRAWVAERFKMSYWRTAANALRKTASQWRTSNENTPLVIPFSEFLRGRKSVSK